MTKEKMNALRKLKKTCSDDCQKVLNSKSSNQIGYILSQFNDDLINFNNNYGIIAVHGKHVSSSIQIRNNYLKNLGQTHIMTCDELRKDEIYKLIHMHSNHCTEDYTSVIRKLIIYSNQGLKFVELKYDGTVEPLNADDAFDWLHNILFMMTAE